ncbi:hypothetical protein O9X98_07135 [Agrobacterium salinitolerans]|nr:hypothetical protein [Agrobacterium salinitolerans]
MKASFYYPMMGTGRTKQGRADKTGVVVGDWVIDIPEASGEDAPVALYVCPDGKPTFGIRWHDGVHYRAFPTEEGISREQDGGLRVGGMTRRIARILGNKMQNDLIKGGARQSYYPDGISAAHVVNDMQNGTCQFAQWRRPDGHFVFDEEGLEEAERWRALAEEAAGCLLVVDGTLWERCDEPVYKIASRASPGVDVLGGRPIAAMKRQPLLADTDPDDRLFNALEYELALDAKAKTEQYRKPGSKVDSDFIEVFLPEAVQYQSDEGELRRLARLLVEDVERGIADATRKATTKWSGNFPIALIAAWNDVRNAEHGVDLPGGLDRLETAVVSLVVQMSPFDANPIGCLRDEDVEALLSRWQDREITLDSAPYGLAKP